MPAMKAMAKKPPKCFKQCRMCRGKGFPTRLGKTCMACSATVGIWNADFKNRCRRLWAKYHATPLHQSIHEAWPRWVKMKIINDNIRLYGDEWAFHLFTATYGCKNPGVAK